jgi:hypothetical protein
MVGRVYTPPQEVRMDALAITIAGFTFSGTLALVVAIIVVVVVLGGWYLMTQRHR